MSGPVLDGASMAVDDRYAVGITCTWHGPMTRAAQRKPVRAVPRVDALRCCPECGGVVRLLPDADSFWAEVRRADRSVPGYTQTMVWSEGRCFPDFDTLQNAYRQAKEE